MSQASPSTFLLHNTLLTSLSITQLFSLIECLPHSFKKCLWKIWSSPPQTIFSYCSKWGLSGDVFFRRADRPRLCWSATYSLSPDFSEQSLSPSLSQAEEAHLNLSPNGSKEFFISNDIKYHRWETYETKMLTFHLFPITIRLGSRIDRKEF